MSEMQLCSEKRHTTPDEISALRPSSLLRKGLDGEVILAYTAFYAVERFGLEFIGGDADCGFVVGAA